MKIFLSLITITLLNGCSGSLYTIVNPDISNISTQKIKGVLVYNPIDVIEMYITTEFLDKPDGSPSPDCIPQEQFRLSTRPDYANPNILVYEPGLLETSKSGFTFDKGVLTSVNIDSDPSQAVAAFTGVLPFFKAQKSEKAELSPSEGKSQKKCNSNPILIGIYKAPDIQSFNELTEVHK